jgi:DNA-binding CsgD family transcriptional regulator
MSRRGRPRHPEILTPREQDVLALLREGRSNEEIAERLGISFTTAKFHVSQIIAKLGVRSRRDAARWHEGAAVEAGGGETRGVGSIALVPIAFARRIGRLLTPAGAAAAAGARAVAVGLLGWGVV